MIDYNNHNDYSDYSDYSDYIDPYSYQANIARWESEGISDKHIKQLLSSEVMRIKGERIKGDGTALIKDGSAFTGVVLLLMLCMFLVFGFMALVS